MIFDKNILFIIGVSTAGVALAFQLFFLIKYYLVFRFRKTIESNYDTSVSIVIISNNQSSELKVQLPLLLEQVSAPHEILIVDCHSEDDTEEYLAQMKLDFPIIRSTTFYTPLVQVKGYSFTQAVNLGFKGTKGEWVFFITPELIPTSVNWFSNIKSQLSNKNEIAIGPIRIGNESGFWHKMLRGLYYRNALNSFVFSTSNIIHVTPSNYIGIRRNAYFNDQLWVELSKKKIYGLIYPATVHSQKNGLIALMSSESILESTEKGYKKLYIEKLISTKTMSTTLKFLRGFDFFTRILLLAGIALLYVSGNYWYCLAFPFWIVFRYTVLKISSTRLKLVGKFVYWFNYDLRSLFIPLVGIRGKIISKRKKWNQM